MENEILYTCSYTPLEILDAFGLVPVRTLGKAGAPEVADSYLHPNLCSYVKSILNSTHGEPPRPILFVDSCDAMRRLSDAWGYFFQDSPLYLMNLPRIHSEEALGFFREELQGLISSLEGRSGQRLEPERLRSSIRAYNALRRALSQLEERLLEGGIGAADYLDLLQEVARLGPREGLKRAEAALMARAPVGKGDRTEEGSRPAQWDLSLRPTGTEAGGTPLGAGPRLMLSGSPLACAAELARQVEASGGRVAYFDTCYTARFYHGLVAEDEEPLAALAHRYLLKTPCARMKGSYERFEELGRVIEAHDIRGVIYHTLKFCDVFIYDHQPFQQFLEQRGVPMLRIETEYDPALPGQVKTRMQAFLEMLR